MLARVRRWWRFQVILGRLLEQARDEGWNKTPSPERYARLRERAWREAGR